MTVSKHAEKRMMERLGINKRSVLRIAQKALDEGIPHGKTKGKLHKYLDKQAMAYDRRNKWRVYGNHLYAFTFNDELVTVLPLKHDLIKYK